MRRALRLLAMLVWYVGFVALAIKSYRLFSQAYQIDSDIYKLIGFMLLAFVLSLLKTRYIFTKSCRNNLSRIDALENPRIWQFYRVGFFIFLLIVISLGAWLSRMASGDYYFLVSVGVVDMALSLALLFSSYVFFLKAPIAT